MDHQAPSPIDGTPSASLSKTILVVVAAFALGFALDPGSLGRWGYMLNDSEAVQPVQAAAAALSDAAAAVWGDVGLAVPFEALRAVSQRGRVMIGAND